MYNYIFVLIIIFVIIVVFYFIYLQLHNNIYSTADIINLFFDKYCNDYPIFDPKQFSWSQNFRNNWKKIREEFLNYSQHYVIPKHHQINKMVASCDNDSKWKTLYLRIFNKNTDISNFFPLTMKLIESCPCTLAQFSVLEPHSKLKSHVGIYKGVIRYHLGLVVPKEWHKCFIQVNDTVLHWSEGSDIMFDDMYPHHVENNTNESRIVLFLDIKRKFNNIFLDWLNSFFLNFVKSNDTLNNTIINVNSFSPKL